MRNIYFTLPWILIFSACFFLLCSCKKEFPNVDPNPIPENPLELEVSNTFDWKTTRDITLEVSGIAIPVSIRNTLQVKSPDELKVYLKNQLFMNEDYSLKFTIPAYESQVVITYGSIRKVIDVTSDILYFEYQSQ